MQVILPKNIKFKDPNSPIEIFCNQKYKNYYIRGQIIELTDDIYSFALEDYCGTAHYRFSVFALVNNSYFENLKREEDGYFSFGILAGRTQEEFLKLRYQDRLQIAKRIAKSVNQTEEELTAEFLKRENPTLLIDSKNISIYESPYVINSIKDKKDIILLSMNISLNKIEPSVNLSKMPSYAHHIYPLLAFAFARNSEQRNDDVMGLFEGLFEMLYFNFDYNFTKKLEYFMLREEISELGYEWITKKQVNQKYIKRLNNFMRDIKDRTQPFYDFVCKFYDSLIQDLIENKQVNRCYFCGDIFLFHPLKKYCALSSEGKDCGKPARNHRFYLKHRDKILPKAKKTTQELRAFYKERGIKK